MAFMAKLPQLALNTSLLPTGSRVAVAVSGGADSTALLLALQEQKHALGIGLSAVHLHHGIRGEEADGDRQFVRNLCESFDIPLYLPEADVPAQAARDRETLEEAARNARKEVFQGLLSRKEADLIATAHTEDDQAETVLLKLIRGAWLEGLGAIHPRVEMPPGALVRPILHVQRAEIEAFLRARGQGWREDSTNASHEYTRNRVRHTLMPLLRDFNPQIAGTLACLSELAREEAERTEREVERLLPQLLLPGKPVRGGGRAVGEEQSVSIEVERLRTLDLPTRRRVLRAAARSLGVRMSAAETMRLLRLCGLQPETAVHDLTVSAKPGAKLMLPSGLVAERSARELRLVRRA
ncbi:MAG: tRNA lysidine(34) synthetase TilS [Acidobacteria bacterium]|nr:tRNA lysidine(34) synthetase TilS [Acidobacteriota bacterium]